MSMREVWEKRLADRRLLFELAGSAVTTVTWSALCFVAAFIVVQGFWTPSPGLAGMGWFGSAIYAAFALCFVAIATVTSGALLIAMWTLILALKWDLEFGPNRLIGFLTSWLGKLWHFAFASFLFVLIAILSIQILLAMGRISLPAAAT